MKSIPLTRGYEAVVDDEDFDRFSDFKWSALVYRDGRVRAFRTVNRSSVYLHREIVSARPGEEVDHRNHNTLDNRKENLRKCSHSQNLANRRYTRKTRSGFKGVFPSQGRWMAKLGENRKQHWLGLFDTPAEAARAYDQKAKEIFGEFALLNFPG